MKATYLGETTCLREQGKTYEVLRIENDGIVIMGKDGLEYWFEPEDFEITTNPIEEKKKQIQEARNLLVQLNKELEEMSRLKIEVGARYMDNYGNSYVLACLEGKYCLVCYDGDYAGCFYTGELHVTPEGAFGGHEQYFTKI